MANPSIHTGDTHNTGNSHNTGNPRTEHHNDTATDDQVLSIDSNFHPLFLHNNDQPGMVLISKKLLGSENYSTWKRSIQIALSAQNKLVIVNGEFLPPSEKSPLYAHWRRVNDMVITWILNTVSDDISNSMNYMDSAFDVWSELSERFSAVSGHKIYEIQKDLFKFEQGNDSVELYFHKLKGFWDELKALEAPIKCTCGASKEWEAQIEKTRLIQFLMGLHSSFTAARGHLLMMNPWPSLNQAFMLIKQEEKQRQVHNTTGNPIALMVNLPKNTQAFRQNDRPNTDRPGISLECSYCHGKNHSKDKCYKLVGYLVDHPYHPNNKGKKRPFTKFPQNASTGPHLPQNKNSQAMQVSSLDDTNVHPSSNFTTQMEALQTQMNSLMKCIQNPGASTSSTPSQTFQYGHNFAGTVLSLMATSNIPSHIWILDTCATNHMCCDLSHMHNLKFLQTPITVKFPNGNTAVVTQLGSVTLYPVSIVTL